MAQQTCASLTFIKGGSEPKAGDTQRFFAIGDWDEEDLSFNLELFHAKARGTTSIDRSALNDMVPDGLTVVELFHLLKRAFSKQDSVKYIYRSTFKKELDGEWMHTKHGWRIQLEVMLDAGGFGQSYYLDFLRMDKGNKEKEQVDLAIGKLISMNDNSSSSAALYSGQNKQLSADVEKLKQTLSQRAEASLVQETEMYSKFVAVLNSKVDKFNVVKEENTSLKQQLEHARFLSTKVKKEEEKKVKKREKKRARIIDAAADYDGAEEDEDGTSVMLRRESSSMMAMSSEVVSPTGRAPRTFRNKKKKRDARTAGRSPSRTAGRSPSRMGSASRGSSDKGKEEEDQQEECSSVAPPTLNRAGDFQVAEAMLDNDSPDFLDLE